MKGESMKGIGGHHRGFRGRTDEWLTPPTLLKQLGQFDLDPCSPIGRPWETAVLHYTVEDDGLSIPWQGRVWLNPPYGPETGVWLQRLAQHGDGIALVFARTETEMFHRHIWPVADAVFFFAGRLHFHDVQGVRAKSNAGAPSMLIAYGKFNAGVLKSLSIPGKFLSVRKADS